MKIWSLLYKKPTVMSMLLSTAFLLVFFFPNFLASSTLTTASLTILSSLLGSISQWGEVKKKQPKSKDSTTTTDTSRGRGRGNAEGRGRGRAPDRGGARGARAAKSATHTNGTKTAKHSDDSDAHAATTTQAADTNGGWDEAPAAGDATAAPVEDWANEPGKDALTSLQTDEPKPASNAVPSTAKPGGWAGLFAKPPPAPAPAPQKAPPPTSVPPPPQPDQPTVESVPAEDPTPVEPVLPPPSIEAELSEEGPSELPSAPHSDTGKDLLPSKDELTEKNLGRLPDTSNPPPSATAASTVASTQDPLAAPETSKPLLRPGLSGYATTALKATGGAGRSASHGRKHIEQQEAVIMPGNHAIEKAAVQFGKLGIGADDVDVDEEREEPETRTQLPDDSPSAPRASLPPSLAEAEQAPAASQPQAPAESQPVQRHAPGLPPVHQQHQASPPSPSAYADQYRYGQQQKPYDPFGQQGPTSQSQTQEPFSNQVPNQPAATASTGPISQNDYSAYYGRDAYYYGYGQDAHRAAGTFGTSAPDAQAQYATARPGQQPTGHQETQGSGNNTPAPGIPSHQNQHSGHLQNQSHYPYGYPNAYSQQYPQYSSYFNQAQAQAQAQVNHRYGANRPMFDDVRRQDSDYYGGQQYNYGGHNQNHYGAAAAGYKYGQPQQGYSYEHSASPANVGSLGREGGYGRTGSAQQSDAQQSAAASTPFGSGADPFGRSSSGFGQSQNLQQHTSHQGSDDPTKVSGPSPSLQGGRPASAVNNNPAQQTGLPQTQQHSGQQAFGGYPQYGSNLASAHQTGHQNSAYGGYGSNTGFGTYGGYGGATRGWNGSYGSGH